MIRALLLASCFHLLLLLSLSRCFVWPQAAKQETQIVIDLPHGELPSRITGRGSKKAIGLSALKPGWTFASGAQSTVGSGEDASSKIVEAKQIGAVEWVYAQTKQHLGYPDAFIRHDIEGRVEAELHFDRSGKLGEIKIDSPSPYLKVYVYRLLERSLQNPIPKELMRAQSELDLLCYFNFQRVESEVAVRMKRISPILGNKLFFEESHLKSKLAWSAGPLSGFFLVPAVALDPLWLLHKPKSIDEDEDLQAYREDPLFRS